MKIFFLNDRKDPVSVQVVGQLRAHPHNPNGAPTIEYLVLQPLESRVFDVDAPDGAIPYVKLWQGCVLLTYGLPEELPVEHRPALSTLPSEELLDTAHEPEYRTP